MQVTARRLKAHVRRQLSASLRCGTKYKNQSGYASTLFCHAFIRAAMRGLMDRELVPLDPEGARDERHDDSADPLPVPVDDDVKGGTREGAAALPLLLSPTAAVEEFSFAVRSAAPVAVNADPVAAAVVGANADDSASSPSLLPSKPKPKPRERLLPLFGDLRMTPPLKRGSPPPATGDLPPPMERDAPRLPVLPAPLPKPKLRLRPSLDEGPGPMALGALLLLPLLLLPELEGPPELALTGTEGLDSLLACCCSCGVAAASLLAEVEGGGGGAGATAVDCAAPAAAVVPAAGGAPVASVAGFTPAAAVTAASTPAGVVATSAAGATSPPSGPAARGGAEPERDPSRRPPPNMPTLRGAAAAAAGAAPAPLAASVAVAVPAAAPVPPLLLLPLLVARAPPTICR